MPLKQDFTEKIAKELQEKLELKNPMSVPRVTKVVINMGVKDAALDKKLIEKMEKIMMQVVGQKPRVTKAKKSIASFKLREGQEIGLMVTLRGKRMYEFLEKLNSIVFPRIRDFRGVSRKSFDGKGNYTLGFKEYAIFPEIDSGSVERMQGIEIAIVTSATNDKSALMLLEAIGVPFEKEKQA